MSKVRGTSNNPEYRYTQLDTEFRVDEDRNQLVGYAARFNSWSNDLGGFKERIAQGAFMRTIKEADVRGLFNHDANFVLGRTSAETMRLVENNSGLKYEIDLPDTSIARDLKESIKRGDITQNSFSFITIEDNWNETFTKRELVEVKLFDVGPVTFPAYEQTSVKVRSAFRNCGIDYDALNVILTKANRNMDLEDKDLTILERTIQTLKDFIPTLSADTNIPLSNEPSQDTLLLLRAKKIDVDIKRMLIN